MLFYNRIGRASLCVLSILLAVSAHAQSFTNRKDFETAAGGPLNVVTFEGLAVSPGQAGSAALGGGEFYGMTLLPHQDAQGLFVGIPDFSAGTTPYANFFAGYMNPTSGRAVLSVDRDELHKGDSPQGAFVVNLDCPASAVGAMFLDVQFSRNSVIAAFDQPDLKGNLVGHTYPQVSYDANGKALGGLSHFAGVVASTARIRSIYIRLAYAGRDAYGRQLSWDGVCLDDLMIRTPNPGCNG